MSHRMMNWENYIQRVTVMLFCKECGNRPGNHFSHCKIGKAEKDAPPPVAYFKMTPEG